MYESFYGLKWRPFAAAPDPAGYVAVGDLRQKHASLRQCVEAGQGIGILTAPAGMGKTLVLRKLLGELRDVYANVFLANSNFASRRALLQAILYELGQPYMNMDEQELRLALTSALRGVRSRRKAVLLAVDEGHLLDDPLLDEIRSVTNLVEHGEPLVRVLLCGQLSLEEKLASPALSALNQRVGCQVTLEPFSRRDSADYIRQRLRWAGAEVSKVFTPDALEAICGIADGVPRCINHLCDHSLLLGYIAQTRPVSRPTVMEALDELRQLPLQWNEPLSSESPVSAKAPDISAEKDSGFVRTQPAILEGASAIEVGAGDSNLGTRLKAFDESAGVIEIGAPQDRDDDATREPQTDLVVAESSDTAEPSSGSLRFDWRKHSRPCLSPPEECNADDHVSEVVEDDFVLEHEIDFGSEDQHSEFEEEVVFDRYAALDADKERTVLPGKFGARPSPDTIIDAVGPMLDELVDTEWNGGCDEFGMPEATQDQSSARTRLYYENDPDESVEEQIGSSVLDTCLETHEAIFGRASDIAAGGRADEPAPDESRDWPAHSGSRDHVEYDVVEPESDGPDSPPKKPRSASGPHRESTGKPDGGNRQCQKLFTELRRRRNS